VLINRPKSNLLSAYPGSTVGGKADLKGGGPRMAANVTQLRH
jgi:hypothetical protein